MLTAKALVDQYADMEVIVTLMTGQVYTGFLACDTPGGWVTVTPNDSSWVDVNPEHIVCVTHAGEYGLGFRTCFRSS